jgi:hypothetical protein
LLTGPLEAVAKGGLHAFAFIARDDNPARTLTRPVAGLPMVERLKMKDVMKWGKNSRIVNF